MSLGPVNAQPFIHFSIRVTTHNGGL